MEGEQRTKETSLYVSAFELEVASCMGLCSVVHNWVHIAGFSAKLHHTTLWALKVLCIILWRCEKILNGSASSCKPDVPFGSLITTLYFWEEENLDTMDCPKIYSMHLDCSDIFYWHFTCTDFWQRFYDVFISSLLTPMKVSGHYKTYISPCLQSRVLLDPKPSIVLLVIMWAS